MDIKELLDLARKAIEAGELDKAEQYQAQAKALMAQEQAEGAYKAVEAEPATKAVMVQVEDEADRALRGNPFKGLGEFLFAVKDARRGQIDKRLLPTKSNDPMDEQGYDMTKALGDGFVSSLTKAAYKAAPTGMGETLPQGGGFLVENQRATGILERVYETGELLRRVNMTGIGPNSAGMTFYANAETSRVAGSRQGGVRGYWVAEASTIPASSPTFRLMDLRLRKAAALVYATDELLADVSALESYVMRLVPEEIRFIVEDAIINGNGTGQPQGILNGGSTVSVAKEGSQVAATLVSQNVIKMWARLWARSQRNAVWLINQDVIPQLYALSLAVGTAGGQLVYTPPGGLSATPYGTLFGRPVIVHESCATLGTKGDIILVDPSEYQMIEKGGITSASSIHVQFVTDQTVFRFIYRVDGQPVWNSALTPLKGTATVSPYVTLDTRA